MSEEKMELCTVREYLYKKTDVFSLCTIADSGYIQAVTYIDSEDLCTLSIPEQYLNRRVESVVDGRLSIRIHGVDMVIPTIQINMKS